MSAGPVDAVRPRLIFIDDDPTARRFMELVLEDWPLELVVCANVAEAVNALAQGPAACVVTDLMMRGESGFDLLERLRREPALRGAAELVVCSAGITDAVRERLGQLGVSRELGKPLGVDAVEELARSLVDRSESRPGAMDAPTEKAEASLPAAFVGRPELFAAFRRECARQFPSDLAEGDKALAGQDAAALRRLGHSLKSVLRSLGQTEAADIAARLEQSAHAGAWEQASPDWHELRRRLQALSDH